MSGAPDVLLATSSGYPHGEAGHAVLTEALARRGLTSRWVVWDDPSVDWTAAGLVAARSTWDYETRLPEFLAWARSVGPTLLNGAEVFTWNTDKAYLARLAEATTLPVVPTIAVGGPAEVPAALERVGLPAVVKPRVGAGGRGVTVVAPGETWQPDDHGPWVVQPLVESVRTEGETSVFVIDGRAVSQVVKAPAAGEVRVHEEHGGRSRATDLDPEAAARATETAALVGELLGRPLDYARVDLLRHDGRLHVSEVEATEPGLYLPALPGNGEAFAALVERRLAAVRA
ncbi:ATP-grasp domain-containing protein [Nocardioides litoris]|uniref:ATP-grasp domain-containing protein n=1 Tax=Nocardioides litoris TaxID=1926648 RepID=UPI00111F5D1E|nr:hypothetical protein [Nocardioides litoris]